MSDYRMKAVAAAERDWRAGVSERNRDSLDRMFRTSGFSRNGAPKDPQARVPDWCGMAVSTWLIDAGMNPGFNTSFLHTLNVEAFFTYGRQKNVNPARLDREMQMTPGVWQSIEDLHHRSYQPRRWLGREKLEANRGQPDLFAPGDVLLIDWSRRDGADHITLVRDVQGTQLRTYEGNASGADADGRYVREAVVTRTLDLASAKDRALIYGVGRLSPLDICTNLVR